jgi:hypothetical protein
MIYFNKKGQARTKGIKSTFGTLSKKTPIKNAPWLSSKTEGVKGHFCCQNPTKKKIDFC